MKTGSLLAGSVLPVLVVAGLCPGQPKQKTFAEEYRAAVNQMNRRQYPNALKALDQLLTKYKEPDEVKQARVARADCLSSMNQHDDALTELAKLRADFKKDKDLHAATLLKTGDILRTKKSFPEAVAAYQKLVKDHADQPQLAADALLRAGDVLIGEMKKHPEGLAAYAQVEKQFPQQVGQAGQSVLKTAVTHETLTKDLLQAAAAYGKLATTYATLYGEHELASYFTKRAACLRGATKLPEAVAALKQGEAALKDNRYKTPLALGQVAILMEMKQYPQAQAECERIVCAYPLEQDVCQAAQTQIVEAWRAVSKFNEGLGAARTLYDAAGSERNIRAAAHVVAQAFRSVDGNLGRANEFLAYQRFGPPGPDGKPNTADDVRGNHLAGVRYPPSNPARDGRFAPAIKSQPATYEGYRARGFLYVYWGKPKEAAQQFRLAFKACPDSSVAAASHELVLIGMKAYTASFYGLETIFEYISYGPKGKTGKENIPDPFGGL